MNDVEIANLARAIQSHKSLHTFVADAHSICCLRCGTVSWNAKDVTERYCGNCHIAHGSLIVRELAIEADFVPHNRLAPSAYPQFRRDVGVDPLHFDRPSLWRHIRCLQGRHRGPILKRAVIMDQVFRVFYWKEHLVKPFYNAPSPLLYQVWFGHCTSCGAICRVDQAAVDRGTEMDWNTWRIVGP